MKKKYPRRLQSRNTVRAKCHPDRPHHSNGLCRACVEAKNYAQKREQILAKHKERYRANPDKYRSNLYKNKYGISLAQYDAMFETQNGLCKVCKKPETASLAGVTLRLAVDHNHKTGLVRGLLCSTCNLSIGKMGEDPTRLRAAAEYLEESISKD